MINIFTNWLGIPNRKELVVFGLAVLIIALCYWWTFSRPEYNGVISFLKTNAQVVQQFGTFESVSLEAVGSEVMWESAGLSPATGRYVGTYRLDVVGAKKSGKLEAHWISNSEHVVHVDEIDIFSDDGTKQELWSVN